MDRDIKLQDLHLHCRACLCELTEIKHNVNGMACSLLKIFKKCADLKKTQSDLYPKSICDQCFDCLNSFHEFQEKTIDSTEFLKNLLKAYKPVDGKFQAEEQYKSADEDFLTEQPYASSSESEVSLPKSEGLQESISDSEKGDDDPLQWAEIKAESTNRRRLKSKVSEQKEENDFESVLVKMEVKEPEEPLNSEKKIGIENTQILESGKDANNLVNKKSKRNVKCKDCDEAFNNAKALKNHMQEEHGGEQIFMCDQCDRGFNRQWRLKLHQNEIHVENPVKIECKFGCGKVFRRAQTAANHYRLKHTPSKVDSTEETMEAESKAEANTTIAEEQNNSSINELPSENKSDDETDHQLDKEVESKIKKKICTICFGMFSNNTALRKHMNTHQAIRPFQCDKCERGFNCKSRLQKHMRELHSENPVEFVCKFGCGKVFKTSDSAGNHYRRQHSGKVVKTDEVACICEDCGRVFKCMTRLKQHSYQHRPVEERPYHCEVCNKRFVFKKTFKEHLLRHKGIKEFECPQCGLKKTTKQELRNHMKYHTDELKTPCPLCNKIFGNPPNLRRHIQLVHEGVKNFKCRFCDEAFGKAETLKHHEMRHTGEKPHKCIICDKSFIQLVALRTHMKTHNKSPRVPKVNRPADVAVYEPTALMDISENTL